MKRLKLWVIAGCLATGGLAEAKEYSNGESESVSCYQNGQLIFETKERVRSFQPTSALVIVAEINLGQVQETAHKIYVNEQSGLVCVETGKK